MAAVTAMRGIDTRAFWACRASGFRPSAQSANAKKVLHRGRTIETSGPTTDLSPCGVYGAALIV